MRAPRIDRDRVKSALGVAAVHALIGFALIRGLGFVPVLPKIDELKTFDVAPEPPPPPPIIEPLKIEAPKEKPRAPDPEGAASPPNLRDTPMPIVAPPQPIPLPTPIAAAPIAGIGNRPSAGAAEVPGPGTGSGGIGTGTGSGRFGNGTGGGGGGGMSRPVRRISGEIYNSDKPRSARRARFKGTLTMTFVAQTNGRVGDCRITRSSGNRELDETTCRLITQRFRYRPALDGDGNPVPTLIVGEHEWGVEDEPPIRDIEPTIPDDEYYEEDW